jgi:DNA-binding response OmpR family regulator
VPKKTPDPFEEAIVGTVQSVLVVDEQEETAEVLATMLARRGVRIMTARRADEGLRMARAHRPDLIVLDADARSRDPEATSTDLDREAREQDTPLVLLANGRTWHSDLERREVLTKPYLYRRLIRRIEELLAQRKAG